MLFPEKVLRGNRKNVYDSQLDCNFVVPKNSCTCIKCNKQITVSLKVKASVVVVKSALWFADKLKAHTKRGK